MSPRDWVMDHMSCERSTRILEDVIRAEAVRQGERWSEGLAVRVKRLSSVAYLSPTMSSGSRKTIGSWHLTSALRRDAESRMLVLSGSRYSSRPSINSSGCSFTAGPDEHAQLLAPSV